jgi:tetratricopeptide (TPR) repeat protein
MIRKTVTLFVVLAALLPAQRPEAPTRAHPARGLQLETIQWMDDKAEFLDKQRFKTSLTRKEAAVDRVAMLDAAIAQARESKKPVLWYVYKVVESTKRGRQMIRAPVLDIAMRQVTWSDPDIERIVKASFTPLRMVCDEDLCKQLNVRPLTFLEPAVIFIAPDGGVLHMVRNIRTINAPWMCGVLRDVLEKAHGKLADDASFDAAMDRGEWTHALKSLMSDEKPTPEAVYQRATLLRRTRDGETALEQLGNALATQQQVIAEKTKDMSPREARSFERSARRGRVPGLEPLGGRFQAERGLILVRSGRFDEAIQPLQNAADTSGPRQAEAAYLLARLRARAGDEVGAVRRFQKVIQDHPDTVWARRARANVLVGIDDGRPIGAAFSGIARLQWLPDAAHKILPIDTTWPGERLPITDIVDRSVRFLLEQQRDDGGWNDARYAYCPDKRITPNVWVAVSSLACQALLRQKARAPESLHETIDDAIRRGEKYLLDPTHMNRGKNEDVYSDAYRLMYLATRHRQLEDETHRRKLRLHMRSIIKDAESRQAESGFWAHEYGNAFCTAAMVQGLVAAKECGVKIPQPVLDSAETALLAARFEDGSFSYGGAARGTSRGDGLKNASTRMPMAEGALLSLGASDDKRMQFAFDTFWKFYDRIEGVRRTDFHSDGQIAGFMFFHALYHTSEAISLLPAGQRSEHHQRLLDHVLGYPEMDGTFMDSHEVGRSYGTAMALLVIANALDAVQ